MIPIGEAIQRLLSAYGSGVQNIDSRYVKRHAYSALLTARARLIRQQSSSNQHLNSWIYSSLPLVELETVSNNIINKGRVSVTRSKLYIPKVVSDISEDLIGTVVSMDGSKTYSISNSEVNAGYQKGSKYSPNAPIAYIKDGRLHITNSPELAGVRIDNGVFEDPLEVYQFNIASGVCPTCACIPASDIEFPIDRNIMGTMIELAIGELTILLQVNADKSNNAQDDVSTSGGMLHQAQQPQQQQQP